MRTRTKTQTFIHIVDDQPSVREYVSEYFLESSYPGSCNCKHFIHPTIHYKITNNEGRTDSVGFCRDLTSYVEAYATELGTLLNWGKLPSSTKAGIIQILAEIDDTIAIFTKKFWTQLSYGSWTWGVVPFVHELLAVIDAVNALGTDLSKLAYEDSYSRFVQDVQVTNWTAANIYADFTFDFHLAGKADMSFQHPGSVALDWLGLHPDLATAWDLIPLSFVVDYLFPLGDWLQSFRQGGWVKAVYFTGWQSYTCKVDCKVVPGGWTLLSSSCESGVYYARSRSGTVLTVDTSSVFDLPDFTFPTFRQLFNMLYLAVLRV